jgi:ribosomal protein L11 methyltransferase
VAWILTITVTPDEIDPLSDRLWELGTSGIALDGSRMMAGFESEPEAEAARAGVGGSVAPVDPAGWDAPAATTIDVGGRSLTIDAGRSFGHGGHPTTQLCLRALQDHLRPGQLVLDVGCGSGILSLAAAALGAGPVTAIDIDLAAVAATRANATTNRIDLDVSTTEIVELRGPFDLIVANMLIAEFEPIADEVRRLAADVIIVSGALVGQRERVLDALAPWARLIQETIADEWLGATFRIEDR